jgi:protein TonB
MSKLFLASIILVLLISGFTSNTSNYRLALSDTVPEKNVDTLKNRQKSIDSNVIFTKAEVSPSIDHTIWFNYLTRNLSRYTEDAALNNVPDGTYTVYVEFLVEQDGRVKDVHALNDVGYGFKQAAIKIIQKSPKWIPARQNGRIVRCYCTQQITFVIGMPRGL